MVGTKYSSLLLHGDSVVMVSIRARPFLAFVEFIWTHRRTRNGFRMFVVGMPWGLLGEQTLNACRVWAPKVRHDEIAMA
jgi:hypothetical protein